MVEGTQKDRYPRRCHPYRRSSRSGLVLVQAFLLVIVLLGFTAALMVVLVGESRAVHERIDMRRAFYLAEAGVEGAKWEIADREDPGGDGIGNRVVTTTTGTYVVSATDLGGETYQLDSTGTAGSTSVSVQAVVDRAPGTTRFPFAALSMIGTYDDQKVNLKAHMALNIHGGDSPGLRITDQAVYNKLITEFSSAVESKLMLPENVTGTGGTKFTHVPEHADDSAYSYELSVVHDPQYPDDLADLGGLYASLVSATATKLGSTTPLTVPAGAGTYVMGSPEFPVNARVTGSLNLTSGQNVVGYGTLFVSEELLVSSGAALDWTGNVFVISHVDTLTSNLTVDGGSLDVAGSLVVLGESMVDGTDPLNPMPSSTLEVLNSGSIVVNGSLFLGTEYVDSNDTQTEMYVYPGGSVTVNGLFTQIGAKVKSQIDTSGTFTVNGMTQIGSPYMDPPDPLRLRSMLQWGGNINLTKDDTAITTGVEALAEVGVELDIESSVSVVTTGGEMYTVSWNPIHE